MMRTQSVSQFLQQSVLPALFERLDQAFPEFSWTRTLLGWKGSRVLTNGRSSATNVACNHPWGFVDEKGTCTSWLHYAASSSRGDFGDAMRLLATRAGVDASLLKAANNSELDDAVAEARKQELLEHFADHCNYLLRTPSGQESLNVLQSRHGVDTNRAEQLGVGVYSSTQGVGEHLVNAGFTQTEIIDSAIVGDARVPGRLVVPWRDRHGQIKTIIARDLKAGRHPDLFLRSGTKTAAFGLDVALRPDAGGREHLVIVDDILDVVYFHSIGVLNVAAIAEWDEPISGWKWEKLADSGVRSVTLAVAADGENRAKIVDSIKATHHAQRTPQVYAIKSGALAQSATAADYVRRSGLPELQNVLKHREHGYRLVAASIVNKYRQAGSWTEVQLLNMLGEAVQFDAEVDDAFRVQQLKQHYWPAILEATGLPWEALRNLLKDREKPDHINDLGSWHISNLKQMVRDLDEALRVEDYVTFKRIVCDAARDFGTTVAAEPAVVFETPSQQWTVDKSKARQFISMATAASRFPLVNIDVRPQEERPAPERQTVPLSSIREVAYHLWEENGRPTGMEQRFWYEAEQVLVKSSPADSPKLRAVA